MARRPIAPVTRVELSSGMSIDPPPGLARRVWRDSVVQLPPVPRGALEAWKHLREGEKVMLTPAAEPLYAVFAECLRPVPLTTPSDLPAMSHLRIFVEGEMVEETTMCPNCVARSVGAFPWERV